MEPGSLFHTKNTAFVRKCGLDPSHSIGKILKISNGFISFYVESLQIIMEARTTEEIFKQHFVLTGEMADLETMAIPKKHFTKNFPTDFM